MHEVSCQGKLAFKTTFLCWVQPIVPLAQSHYRIFWWSLSLEGINWYVRFFIWRCSSRDGSIWDYLCWLHVVKCASHSIKLQDPLISTFSGRNYLIWDYLILNYFISLSLTSCNGINIEVSEHLRLPLLVGCNLMCLLSNLLTGFSGQQYLWKASIDILDLLCMQFVIKGR